MSNRITRYGVANGSGGHNLGLRVLGVQLLICPTSHEQTRAERLARAIASLGPEGTPKPGPGEHECPNCSGACSCEAGDRYEEPSADDCEHDCTEVETP